MNNFYSALAQANILYGIEMSEDEFAELGLNAWNFIGNKTVKLHRYSAQIDCNTLTVDLPCNADIIEAVTSNNEDWNYTSNIYNNGDQMSLIIENDIEHYKANTNPLYQSGQYVHYKRIGDRLYFDRNYGTINILYKGIVLDDDGLPEITDKEAIAIATYVAYVQKFKQGLITNNAAITNMANLLKSEWLRYCDAARIPDYISQNDMNEILDVKFRWDRKAYNHSYKPLR